MHLVVLERIILLAENDNPPANIFIFILYILFLNTFIRKSSYVYIVYVTILKYFAIFG